MSPSSAIPPDSFQRAHNYHHLIARWRRVARASGVPLRPLAKADNYTVYFLDYRPADAHDVIGTTMPTIKGVVIAGDFNTNHDQDMFAAEEHLIRWLLLDTRRF